MTRLVGLGTLLGMASLVTGCGVSDYDQLLDRGVARIRSEAKFQGLFAPVRIPDMPYTVRVPVIFPNSFTPTSSHPDDGGKIRPQRMQPPFVGSDDVVKLTFEGKVEEGNRKLPFYCYLAGRQVKPGEVDQYANVIEKAAQAAVQTGPKPTWELVDADTPEGKGLHWRKMRVEGDQPFFVLRDGDDKAELETMPGILELWLHDAGEYAIMILWRAPKEIQGSQERDIQSINGLVVPLPNVKPDLSKWPVLTAGTLAPASP